MKKLFLAAPLALALALAGCGETSVQDVSSEKETKASAQDDSDKIYKVGDTVKIDGVKVKITKATFTDAAEYVDAENGKVLTLDVKIVNTNKESAFIDETEFNLYSKSGEQFESYFGYDKLPISADLNAGKQKSGKLYYDVAPAKVYELVYSPMFSWDNKEIKWKIKVQ